MRRLVLVPVFAIVLASAAVWTGDAQQPANPANAARFTGTSTSMDGKELTIARRRFEAGARTYWHSHARGQLLLVEQGKMRVQRRGGPMREIATGETDYVGPNVPHWHGAAPDQPAVQVNAGFGGVTTWLEEVAAADYNGGRAR
ncbi:MAG: cupin domain-containing protein [Vicinamibacterales bacterium]